MLQNNNTDLTDAEKLNRYIRNSNSPDEETETEREDERIEKISGDDVRSLSDTITLLIVAFVMVFFGTVFIALTNYQDFSEKEGFSWERFSSGKLLSDIEKDFNESLPLADYLHNAESAIKLCYGSGNTADYIDIEAKLAADDPYSVEDIDQYVPYVDEDSDYTPVFGNLAKDKQINLVTTENKKNKKIEGVTLDGNHNDYFADPSNEYTVTQLDLSAPYVTETYAYTGQINTVTTYPKTTTTTPAPATTTTPATTPDPNQTVSSDTQPANTDPNAQQPPESETVTTTTVTTTTTTTTTNNGFFAKAG